jgi:hypothetical protein
VSGSRSVPSTGTVVAQVGVAQIGVAQVGVAQVGVARGALLPWTAEGRTDRSWVSEPVRPDGVSIVDMMVTPGPARPR